MGFKVMLKYTQLLSLQKMDGLSLTINPDSQFQLK